MLNVEIIFSDSQQALQSNPASFFGPVFLQERSVDIPNISMLALLRTYHLQPQRHDPVNDATFVRRILDGP